MSNYKWICFQLSFEEIKLVYYGFVDDHNDDKLGFQKKATYKNGALHKFANTKWIVNIYIKHTCYFCNSLGFTRVDIICNSQQIVYSIQQLCNSSLWREKFLNEYFEMWNVFTITSSSQHLKSLFYELLSKAVITF